MKRRCLSTQILTALLDLTCENVLLIASGDQWMLPEFAAETDFWIADVATVNRAIHKEWNIETTVLRCLASSCPDRIEVFVAYVKDRDWQPPAGASWFTASALPSLSFAAPAQLALLEQWFANSTDQKPDVQDLPWTSPSWFDEVKIWIADQVKYDSGQSLMGELEQVKSWAISSVLRARTETETLYFKAVPTLFGQEPVITQQLALLFPEYIPSLVAVDTARHWMLMREFVGKELDESKAPEDRAAALPAFAKIQIGCIPYVDELISWGSMDRRLALMANQVEAVIYEMTEADAREIYAITDEEAVKLRQHAPALRSICLDLASFGVPETLIHGDLHAGNIIVNEVDGQKRFLIFDWTDAAIGHPFFDMQTMLQGKWMQDHPNAATVLRDAYLEPWTKILPIDTLIAAFDVSQKLAPLYHAISYRNIAVGVPPSSRWELSEFAGHYLRTLLSRL